MVYKDGYESDIIKAFEEIPHADAIIFDINNSNPKTKNNIRIRKIKRLNAISGLKYGACRIAIRRSSLLAANVWFSLLFGGGAKYCSGEDTLFIRECIKKGLKVYTYPQVIADVNQETSTWFVGHNKSYFNDRGALLKAMFPRLSIFMAMIYAVKYKDRTDEYSVIQIFKYLIEGINN